MPIKLVYFKLRARAEVIRYILHQAEVEFEDYYVSQEEWAEKKPMKSPFGKLPYVEIDDVILGQSISIARFFANKYGLAGKTDIEKAKADQLVDGVVDLIEPMKPALLPLVYGGDKNRAMELLKKFEEEYLFKFMDRYENFLTMNNSEFFVGNGITWADLAVAEFLDHHIQWNPSAFEKYPGLTKHHDMVYSLPRIKAYVSQRPPMPL